MKRQLAMPGGGGEGSAGMGELTRRYAMPGVPRATSSGGYVSPRKTTFLVMVSRPVSRRAK